MFYILPFKFYVLPFTFYISSFTFYVLPFTIYLLPFFDVHGSWLMAGKSLVSLAALLVEILDMREEGGEGGEEEEEVQVITLVTLNLWVWGFRVEPTSPVKRRVKPVDYSCSLASKYHIIITISN